MNTNKSTQSNSADVQKCNCILIGYGVVLLMIAGLVGTTVYQAYTAPDLNKIDLSK